MDILKGKSSYKPMNIKSNIQRIPLPPVILETHPSEALDIDFFYVQGAPYLTIKSVSIKFQGILAFNKINRIIKRNQRKVTYKRGPSDIINGIEKILRLLNNRGFKTPIINADNEFSKLENKHYLPISKFVALANISLALNEEYVLSKIVYVASGYHSLSKKCLKSWLTNVSTWSSHA